MLVVDRSTLLSWVIASNSSGRFLIIFKLSIAASVHKVFFVYSIVINSISSIEFCSFENCSEVIKLNWLCLYIKLMGDPRSILILHDWLTFACCNISLLLFIISNMSFNLLNILDVSTLSFLSIIPLLICIISFTMTLSCWSILSILVLFAIWIFNFLLNSSSVWIVSLLKTESICVSVFIEVCSFWSSLIVL